MSNSEISQSTQNVLDYLASFEMFKPAHTVTVGWVPNNHGYPYRAQCSCGWESNTYAAEHAAQNMADEHAA